MSATRTNQPSTPNPVRRHGYVEPHPVDLELNDWIDNLIVPTLVDNFLKLHNSPEGDFNA